LIKEVHGLVDRGVAEERVSWRIERAGVRHTCGSFENYFRPSVSVRPSHAGIVSRRSDRSGQFSARRLLSTYPTLIVL